MDYKNTLNLPRTDFAMKADLVAREPLRLQKWEKENLYARIQAARVRALRPMCRPCCVLGRVSKWCKAEGWAK